MSEKAKDNYSNDRYDAAAGVSSSLHGLASTIDYLNKESNGSDFSLYQFLMIYAERLDYKASLAGRSTHHAIAYISHNLELHERVAAIFNNVASSIEGRDDVDRYLFHVIKETQKEIADDREQANLFAQKYADEISAEQATDGYVADCEIIKEVVGELAQVTRLGQWTPEYVTVTDHVTGQRRPAEPPSSEKMGRIARMAPQLRQLGWGLGDS